MARIRLSGAKIRRAELHWYEADGIGRREFKRKRYLDENMRKSKASEPVFAVCMNNEHYPTSLELHKIYRVIPDENAAKDGDIRVVDESGEDYLYRAKDFVVIDLPAKVRGALLEAS